MLQSHNYWIHTSRRSRASWAVLQLLCLLCLQALQGFGFDFHLLDLGFDTSQLLEENRG